MTLKKQLSILLWLFGVGFLVMAVLVINLRGPETTIKWSMDGIFRKKVEDIHVNAPILKDDKRAAIVDVGSMVFISGVNIEKNSVVMLDNKIMNKADYTIAENEGVYLQAPREGVFSLVVTNKYGPSNQVSFEVSNAINIHVANDLNLLANYDSLTAWVGGVRIPINDSGQAIAPPGLLKEGDIIVKGLSKTTGKLEVISMASLNKHQKSEGIVISPYTTARYMLDKRLSNLGLKPTSNNPSDQQALLVGNIDSYIRNMQLTPEFYSLSNPNLEKELTKTVRDIRKRRD